MTGLFLYYVVPDLRLFSVYVKYRYELLHLLFSVVCKTVQVVPFRRFVNS